MLLVTSFSCFLFLICLYSMLGTWAYRRPWVLLLVGMLASAFAVVFKMSPTALKGVLKYAQGLPWTELELDIAASLVDPTLIGLSGGLISAAFLLKLQMEHAQELQYLRAQLSIAERWQQDIEEMDEELKRDGPTLTDSAFRDRYKRLLEARATARADLREARKNLNAADQPGL